MAGVPNYLWTGGDPDQNIIHQEILYAIYCKIDHAGVVEGANPDVFIFAVHEILHLFLSRRDRILATLCRQPYGKPQEVYSELIEAALQMQRLALECRCAYWTSGNEGDRALLVGAMRRCQLPPGAKEFEELAPELRQYRKEQVGRLHQLALSDRFDEKLRKRLSAIRAV